MKLTILSGIILASLVTYSQTQAAETVAAAGKVHTEMASDGSDRTKNNAVAADGSDRTKNNAVAADGSDRTKNNAVAEGGSDRTKDNAVDAAGVANSAEPYKFTDETSGNSDR